MRILEGVGTVIQLAGLMARLCKMVGLFVVILDSCPDYSCFTRTSNLSYFACSPSRWLFS
jgi:hypothetical protein